MLRRPMASCCFLSLVLCGLAGGWLATAATVASAAPAAPAVMDENSAPVANGSEKITLEFDNVDINVVVKFISQLVHKNFIISDAVKGKVTVISPVPVTVDQAYEIFLSILEVKGFAAVPSGRVVKIIPAAVARAKRMPTVTADTEGGPTDDRIRTQLIQLEHVDASRVVPLIKPLIAKTSNIESFDEANTILLTDVASNIDRIVKIIRVIDTPGFQQQLAILPLKYATAEKLAGQISSVFGGSTKVAAGARAVRRGAAAPTTGLSETEVKVFADDRTNTLIVFATKNDLEKVKQLVTQLDIAPPENNSRVRIYRLQHAVAEELANVLAGVVSAKAHAAPDAQRAQGAVAQAEARSVARRAAGGRGGGVLSDEASIISDASTNSLIVTASPEEHAALEALIAELDIQPLQVFVEALIVEVGLTTDFNLGVEWRALAQKGSNGVVIGNATNSGALDAIAAVAAGAPPKLPTGLAIGFLGDTIEFNGVTLPSLGALVTALKGNSGANIISTPQILTVDNKEAEFDAVQTIPFQTGTSTGTGVNVVSTFDFRDVGTKLKITPHINKEGYVRMEISQEVSNVVDSSTIGLPTTSKRSANTVAVVKDNNTIVIGGLISNQATSSQSKVPLLGDIPLLGALFRSTHKGTEKTNLLIFITPHVIQQAEALRPFTDERSRNNHLLHGKEFKGMMRESFPKGFPGVDGQGSLGGMAGGVAEGEVPAVVEGVTPVGPAGTTGAPVAAAAASSPPAAANLTERLRSLLSLPAAGGSGTAPAPAVGGAPVGGAPAAEGDELMERLHNILETPAAAATASVPPAATLSTAEEEQMKELQQPLFEPPAKRGWFGRMIDRLRGKGEAEASPATTPDAVSPIYRYTPEATPPAGSGEGGVPETN